MSAAHQRSTVPPPWGYTAQPDFINAVIRYRSDLAPLALLDLLQSVEQQQGRERPFKNAPRTLDLDLLAYDDLHLDHPRLTPATPRHLRTRLRLASACRS